MTREVMMFATRQRPEPVNAEANRFLFELEQDFDLMRLRARRAVLQQEETQLVMKQEFLRNELRPPVASSVGPSEAPVENGWMRVWWLAVATRLAIWRLKIRRVGVAEEIRRLALLEEDIEFALRLRRRRSRG
jgi:hypothetical protein